MVSLSRILVFACFGFIAGRTFAAQDWILFIPAAVGIIAFFVYSLGLEAE